MSNRLEYGVLYDMSTGHFVPIGLWVIKDSMFDHYYVPGEMLYHMQKFQFDEVPFSDDNTEFWEYWTSQGYDWTIVGPFIVETELTGPAFGKEGIENLDKLIKKHLT